MEIVEFRYPNIPENKEDITICLGFFDGIHLGHQTIFKKAQKEGYKVAVLTFDNTPAFVVGKINENMCLTSIADKVEYLSELNVDILYLMHFDLAAAALTKDQFIDEILKPLKPKKIFCGEDYRFGARGEGDTNYLSLFFPMEVVPIQKMDGVKISSRDIKFLIQSHKISKANELLGRPYRINGLVVDGQHRGKSINFPTANLKLDYPYVFPDYGVYMGYAEIYGRKYKAIINVGTHPTVIPLYKPIIEVHIIDFEGNIYGKDIFVEFIDYIRSEKKFESMEDLRQQLEKDKEKAKNTLK